MEANAVWVLAEASDPDGDPITYAFEWARNGVTLPDETDTRFHGDFSRGDTLSVAVTVSDGRASRTRRIAATVGNSAPLVTGIQLTPEAPRGIDPVEAQVYAYDFDDDPLTYEFTWTRNGTVLEGQTGATLPAGLVRRGDTLGVTVTASDGESVGTGQAAVLILDSPPALAPEVPDSLIPGTAYSFAAGVTEIDGDPWSVSLLYGPPGMTVDASGKVSWVASEPPLAFGDQAEVRFGLEVGAGGLTAQYQGRMSVRMPDRRPPLVRTGLWMPCFPKGIRVGDLDGDGRSEVVVTDNGELLYTLRYDGTGYVQDWVYPLDLAPGGRITSYALADLNEDGGLDLIVGAGSKLVVIDGKTKRVTAEADHGVPFQYSMEVADVDGDGAPEVVFLGSTDAWSPRTTTLYVFDATTLSQKWRSPEPDQGEDLAIGKLTAAPGLRIVTSGGYVYGYDGESFVNEWAYGPGFGWQVAVGDVNGDGVDEIVASSETTTIFSASRRSALLEIPTGRVGALMVAHVDDTGRAKLVVGRTQSRGVTVYDVNSEGATVEWSLVTPDGAAPCLAVGDPDGDGRLELIWDSDAQERIVVARLGEPFEWTNQDPPQLDGPFFGARWVHTPPGESRAVFATPQTDIYRAGARLIAIDPETGKVSLSQEIGTEGIPLAPLTSADVDGDGADEVFLAASNDHEGLFTVFDFSRGEVVWTFGSALGIGVVVAEGDLNQDGRPDFVVLTDEGFIYALDTLTNTPLWQSGKLAGYGAADLKLYDLDGDGLLEIVAASTEIISVFHRSGDTYVLEQQLALKDARLLAVADFRGQGTPQIVAAASPSWYEGGPTQVVVYDGRSFSEISRYSVPNRVDALALVPGPAGTNALLAATTLALDPNQASSTVLTLLDPMTGPSVWETPALIGRTQPNSLSVADFDGNGRLDVLLGTDQGMYISW